MFLMSLKPGGLRDVLQRRIVGMERQRNEGHEAVGLVLQRAQAYQVIDAVLVVLDVAVEHGAVGVQAQLVRGARGLEPLVAVDLVIADDAAHALVEDLGAAAGQRIHAGVAQALQRFADGDLRALREVADLHHGERLQVHLREALLQAAQHLAVPVERQFGMQAADDVEFGDRLAPAFAGAVPDLFERHGVGLGILAPSCRTRTAATGHAHIGGIDVAVDVEVGLVAVQALAHQVGQVAERQDVGGAVERQAVFEGQPLARFHLVADRLQTGVVKYDLHVFRHPV